MTKPSEPRTSSAKQMTRRAVLSATAAGAALTLAPGVILMTAGPAEAKATDKVRWGLLVDTTKLDQDACDALVAACNVENGLSPASRPEATSQWIRRVDIKDRQSGVTKSLPVMCQHCEFPPCADVCPTGASFRRADGIVLVDKHICIGCRYCMLACPYKARSFGYEDIVDQKPYSPRGKGTVQACTLCVHRIDAGREPACVEACETVAPGAMVFGDLKDPNSAISKKVAELMVTRIRADLGVEPGVLYAGL